MSSNGPHAPVSPTALQNSVPHNVSVKCFTYFIAHSKVSFLRACCKMELCLRTFVFCNANYAYKRLNIKMRAYFTMRKHAGVLQHCSQTIAMPT